MTKIESKPLPIQQIAKDDFNFNLDNFFGIPNGNGTSTAVDVRIERKNNKTHVYLSKDHWATKWEADKSLFVIEKIIKANGNLLTDHIEGGVEVTLNLDLKAGDAKNNKTFDGIVDHTTVYIWPKAEESKQKKLEFWPSSKYTISPPEEVQNESNGHKIAAVSRFIYGNYNDHAKNDYQERNTLPSNLDRFKNEHKKANDVMDGNIPDDGKDRFKIDINGDERDETIEMLNSGRSKGTMTRSWEEFFKGGYPKERNKFLCTTRFFCWLNLKPCA